MLDSPPNAFTPLTPNAAASFAVPSFGLGDYYRALYSQIRHALADANVESATVGVTSCVAGEGVSTVCQNVAIAAAHQLRKPVLLIDANSGTRTSKVVTSGPSVGLYDVLSGRAQPIDCIRPGATRGVFVFSAGERPTEGQDHFPKRPFIDLLGLLSKEFAFVLVDLPPCSELTDCLSIAGLLDGVLLVVEAERVRSQVVAHARDHLFQAGSRFLGVVLNKRKNHVPEWLYRRL